jgi:hypothetical protein
LLRVLVLLLLAVALPGWLLRGELDAPPDLNDTLVHQALTDAVRSEWRAGRSGLDPWIDDWAFGYPVLHHYQPGAYWLTAAVAELLPGEVASARVVDGMTWGLQTLFPLLLFASLVWLGAAWTEAGAAALLGALISSPGLYGWEFAAYGWGGSGLYAQLVAVWFFLPTLVAGYRALRAGERVWPASLLLALTTLCHLMYGYMAAIALLGLLLPAAGEVHPPRLVRLGRLLRLCGGTALLTLFFVLPFLLDREFVLHSRWEPSWKWDSFGWQWGWNLLASGDLCDTGKFTVAGRELVRPPVLLLLAVVGIWTGRRRSGLRFLFWVATFWFAVSLGRETWGGLLRLLPFSSELHLHRMVGPMQLLLPVAAGCGLVRLLRWPATGATGESGWRWLRWGVTVGCVVLGLSAALLERSDYAAKTRGWMARTREALAVRPGLVPLLASFDPSVTGRVFAGRPQDFGRELRVGSVPFYALLAGARVPTLSYLYMAMAPPSDFFALYDPRRAAHSEIFGVSTQILPASQPLPEGGVCVHREEDFQLVRLATTPWFALVDLVADLHPRSEEDSYQACAAWLAGSGPERGEMFRLRRDGGDEGGLWTLPGAEVAGAGPPPDGLFTASAAPSPLSLPPLPSRGRIDEVSVARRGGAWRAQVDLQRPAELLLAVSFHPGLHAWVDGAEVEVDELALHFAGVALTRPGSHAVRVEYRSQPWRGPLLVGGLLLFGLTIVEEERRRRRRTLRRTLLPDAATAE